MPANEKRPYCDLQENRRILNRLVKASCFDCVQRYILRINIILNVVC